LRSYAAARTFPAFRSRDFRFQWPADLLTSWAFEMEVLILGWYVLVTTESVFILSILGALSYIGTLFAPAFGVAGDRIGHRNLLLLMRMATPEGIPGWQVWAGFGGSVLFTLLLVWISGRVFRGAILMQGTPPKLRNFLRWATRG